MRAPTAAIESILDGVHRPGGPGVAVVVSLRGEVAYRSCRGLANLEYAEPITPQTTFHVASLSKQFTAFALAVVADRGLIDLDSDIKAYLPDFPRLGVSITPRQLAHHTSGLRDQWAMLMLSGWRLDDVITTDDVLGLVRRSRTLNFEPDTSFSYSNTGYTLIGELIRAVDGRSLREFCAREIFEPLGMTSTHFHDDYRELVTGRAYSYNPTSAGGSAHALLPYGTVGATGLHTTVDDLARWDRNLTSRHVGAEGVFGLMDRSAVLADGTDTGYAFGLMHDEHRGVARAYHPGNDAGFRAYGERYPALGLSLYLLANSSDLNAVALGRRIGDVLLDEAGVPRASVGEAPPDDGSGHAGHYVNRRTGATLELVAQQGEVRLSGVPVTRRSDGRMLAPGLELEPWEYGSGLTLHTMAAAPERMHRITPVAPTPDELREYVGSYWSDELETRYVVELSSGSLTVRHPKLGAHRLVPTIADHFTARWEHPARQVSMAIAFDRVAGVVESMRLSLPRVDNVVLVR